ncbi:MAG: hypothetical protein MAG581_00747 [Deltaproteobacteria bacterium]|jgi:hypothetical protein|nr:hypothetical protein [Deltaproteobacteria bacterium]
MDSDSEEVCMKQGSDLKFTYFIAISAIALAVMMLSYFYLV